MVASMLRVLSLACCLLLCAGARPQQKQKLSLSSKSAPSAIPAQPVQSTKDSFITGLLSGAVAGTTVDLVLFPLDTVKTRLQAKAGTKVGLGLFKGVPLASCVIVFTKEHIAYAL
jgi:Mitochondrial carrier protein